MGISFSCGIKSIVFLPLHQSLIKEKYFDAMCLPVLVISTLIPVIIEAIKCNSPNFYVQMMSQRKSSSER